MQINIDCGEIILPRNQILSAVPGESAQIHCRKGSVWITQDSDQRDVILDAGEVFSVDRPGKVVVHALRPSAVMIEAARL